MSSVSAGQSVRPPSRRLLAPTLLTAVMLVALICLGVWQLHRRTWKLGLLAAIDHAEAGPAIPLPDDPRPFAKVEVTGRLMQDKQALYGTDVRDLPGGPVIGAYLIEPMERPGADPVLIDLGWVPEGVHPTSGPTSVQGYVRLPDAPGLFSPNDSPSQRRFYTLNPAAIGAALGLPHVAPFTLVALGPAAMSVFPQPATSLPRPPNDHLSYAITWFSLAAVLLVIFVLYARKVLRP